MIDAGVFALVVGRLYLVYDSEDGVGQVESIGRSSALVEHYLQLWLCGSEVEHCLAEVLAKLRVEPCGADDDILATACHDFLFAVKLGCTIYACRSSLLLGSARYIVWFLAKDVVGGNLHEQSACLLHCQGKVLWSIGIQFLCKCCQLLVVFAGIHIGPCRTVDDGVYVVLAHHLAYGVHVCNVEVSGFHAFHLVHVGEEIVVCGVLAHDSHLVAELSVGSCH